MWWLSYGDHVKYIHTLTHIQLIWNVGQQKKWCKSTILHIKRDKYIHFITKSLNVVRFEKSSFTFGHTDTFVLLFALFSLSLSLFNSKCLWHFFRFWSISWPHSVIRHSLMLFAVLCFSFHICFHFVFSCFHSIVASGKYNRTFHLQTYANTHTHTQFTILWRLMAPHEFAFTLI